MKKFFYLCAIHLFLIPAIGNSQYKLRVAFPNLSVFSNPVEMVNAGDGTNRLFVLQQNGLIYVFNNSPTVSTRKLFLNLQATVTQGGSETGLLGLAFHPDYENNRYLYVSYTFDSSGNMSRTWSRIIRYTADPDNPDSVLLNSAEIFLTISQPDLTHKAGHLAFGPEGYLYLSFGDGGGDGDPFGYGQNKFSVLGKILRINVDSASGGKNYSIPVTNPFYGTAFAQEIYAYGFRNTWKFSFDFPSNRMWGGDVGQFRFEEVNLIEKGKNYGWSAMEGFHCYPDTNNCDTTGKGYTLPIIEYRHNVSGNAVAGGYVYRGSLLPGLYGKYLYGDYVFGTIWALTYDGVNPAVNVQVLDSTLFLSSFGVDENNEFYALRYSSQGRIYKIVDVSVSTLNLKASIEGFYDVPDNKLNIRDTVSVYLRQIYSPFDVVDSAKTVLDSLTFSGLCFFSNAPTGKYYIQLKHRSGLETWSRSGGDSIKKGAVVNYDFTTDSTLTFGDNVIFAGSKYSIYSGDVNGSGVINLTDVIAVFNDQALFLNGYYATDLTGNGIVNLSDLEIVVNNATKFISLIRPLP